MDDCLWIHIIADGWPRDVFLDLLSSGQLREIADEIIDPGVLLDEVLTIIPSVSLASHTTLLTGHAPRSHRVPGHRWMDSSGAIHSYLGTGIRNLNADISTDLKTFYELRPDVPSYAVQSLVSRGADKVIRRKTVDPERILDVVADIAEAGPASISAWLPGGDIASHRFGPTSPQLKEEMLRASIGVGSLVRRLTKAGQIDRAKILFTTDHGHRGVARRVNLASVLRSTLGESASLNPRIGRGKYVVLSNGDASAFIYSQQEHPDRLREIASTLVQRGQADNAVVWYNPEEFVILSQTFEVRFKLRDGDLVQTTEAGTPPADLFNGWGTRDSYQDSVYPDMVVQIFESYVPGRSASMMVTAPHDTHYGRTPRMGLRFGYHRGTHGGAHRDETLVFAAARGTDLPSSSSPLRSRDLLEVCGFVASMAQV